MYYVRRHECGRTIVWYGCCRFFVFFFKQKTAYEMRISDWSSDVCSSDLPPLGGVDRGHGVGIRGVRRQAIDRLRRHCDRLARTDQQRRLAQRLAAVAAYSGGEDWIWDGHGPSGISPESGQ